MFNLDDIAYSIVSSKVLDTYWELSKYLLSEEKREEKRGEKKKKEIRKKEEVERS